ncbi:permease-like cell division protein FtsX [Catellatospora paridis]|uniref:permease-like cell division protein FtsX n=1 Tax=Catellatospora paridis TaxID=1617086 RepID=UPI001E47B7D7|nr:permease-like cell division protein FtsX [Catellatospora paridis]
MSLSVVGLLLVGALTATGVMALTGRLVPENRFTVTVYLDRDIDAGQKAALQSALAALDGVEGVKYESREEAWQLSQQLLKADPALAAKIKVDDLPDSFNADFAEVVFDCERLTPLTSMAGADTIVVLQRSNGRNQPTATIACGNLL